MRRCVVVNAATRGRVFHMLREIPGFVVIGEVRLLIIFRFAAEYPSTLNATLATPRFAFLG